MKFAICLELDKEDYDLLKEWDYNFKKNLEQLIEDHANELRKAIEKNGKSNKTIKKN